MAKLAFLGTGLIGAALAEAAAKRGDEVTAWNRTRSKAEPLAAHGVRVAATAAEAVAGAERVHLAFPDDAVIESVLEACGPALRTALVVDHSTASPRGTAARAARLHAQGISYLHAPVFMSPAMCLAAGGAMMVAGPQALFDRAAPGLRAMTGKVEYLGERPDLAAANKLFGNAIILTTIAGLADVLAMAKSLDIPAADAVALFAKVNVFGSFPARSANMAKGDYRPSFELEMARKDTRLMLETAAGATLTVLPALAKRMDDLLAKGHKADDVGILAVESVPKRQ